MKHEAGGCTRATCDRGVVDRRLVRLLGDPTRELDGDEGGFLASSAALVAGAIENARTLPVSVVEWLLIDDPTTLEGVVHMKLTRK